VFLFDEPLSNLDAKLRVQMRGEIRSLHDRLKATTIYVTHDQVEAMTMADKIVVMQEGRVEQVGTPMDLYNHPANLFVATFLGSPEMNLLPAKRKGAGFDLGKDGILDGEAGSEASGPDDITLGIRPHDIKLRPVDDASITATIKQVERTGAETVVVATLPSQTAVCAVIPGQIAVTAGEQIGLDVDRSKIHCFDKMTGNALAA